MSEFEDTPCLVEIQTEDAPNDQHVSKKRKLDDNKSCTLSDSEYDESDDDECDSRRRKVTKKCDVVEEEKEENFVSEPDAVEAAEAVPEQHAVHPEQTPVEQERKLWILKCRRGQEKDTAVKLRRKCLDSSQDFKDSCVYLPECTSGWIYVEAVHEKDVKDLIAGISAVASLNATINSTAQEEMARIIQACTTPKELKPNQFVRVMNGKYKNDLAEVVKYNGKSRSAEVRLLPRIDYVAGKRGKRGPPMAKPFNRDAVIQGGGLIDDDGEFQVFEGNRFKDGFLYMWIPCESLSAGAVRPSTTELERFKKSIPLALDFEIDERVMVSEGQRAGITGRIVSRSVDDVFTLQSMGMKEPMTFQREELKRYFVTGDNVKIIDGTHKGQTGLVIGIQGEIITFVADEGMNEIEVWAKDAKVYVPVFKPPATKQPTGGQRPRGQYHRGGAWAKPKGAANGACGQKFEHGFRGKNGGGANRANRGPLQMIGKEVRVVCGPLKGQVGTVKGVTGGAARVKFHTSFRCLHVDLAHLTPFDSYATTA